MPPSIDLPQVTVGKTDEIKQKKYFGPICEQGLPDGRFCGFELKFTYNRETGHCDQFWYPGCRTENTNDNLFSSINDCQKATDYCANNKQGNFMLVSEHLFYQL